MTRQAGSATRQIRLTPQEQATLLEIEAADLKWFAQHPAYRAFDRPPYPQEVQLAEKMKQIKPQASNRITVMLVQGKIVRGFVTQ